MCYGKKPNIYICGMDTFNFLDIRLDTVGIPSENDRYYPEYYGTTTKEMEILPISKTNRYVNKFLWDALYYKLFDLFAI